MVWLDTPPLDVSFVEQVSGLWGGATIGRCFSSLQSIARSKAPVVIQGATGTGKEATARAIHAMSGVTGPFVPVNCATLTEALADAQLFGHRRGAFSGATTTERGYFSAAEQGTLFLDEVVELPLAVQAKLLRVLQEREFYRIGETIPSLTTARIVTASQAPLERYVQAGKFRQDLAARLESHVLCLPPISKRREDIPYLFCKLLERELRVQPRLHPLLIESLCLRPWLSNVRELQHLAGQTVILAGSRDEYTLEDLPARGTPPRLPPNSTTEPASAPIAASGELELLRSALVEQRGNVRRAAEQLGLSRGRVYRLLARTRLEPAQFRQRFSSDKSRPKLE